MSIPRSHSRNRFGWLAFPLVVFAASRALLLAFAASARLFGERLGTDGGVLVRYPIWARLAHGDIADYARVARAGYLSAADAGVFPLAAWLGRGMGALLGSVELALAVLSLVACAVAFCGLYRLLEVLRGVETARWGLGLLAAFPFAYHLSDGSALGLVLALSTWGVLLAVRARFVASAAVLSLAALAHPMAVLSIFAAAIVPSVEVTRRRPDRGEPLPAARGEVRRGSWVAAACAVLVWIGWLGYVVFRLHLGGAGLFGALFPSGPSSHLASAMVLGFGGVAASGVIALARQPRLRALAVIGALEIALTVGAWTPAAAIALVLCWPAFLGLGDIVARYPAWRAPLVAMLGAHQGLLLYCFTQFLHQT